MKFLREDEQSELSVEAQKFLLQYPEFTDHISEFEAKFDIERSLSDSKELLDFALSGDIWPALLFSIDDYEFDLDYDDWVPEFYRCDYWVDEQGRLCLQFDVRWTADTEVGTAWHPATTREPGYYDMREVTVYATADFSMVIPEDVDDDLGYITVDKTIDDNFVYDYE